MYPVYAFRQYAVRGRVSVISEIEHDKRKPLVSG